MSSLYLYCLSTPACVPAVGQLLPADKYRIDERQPIVTLEQDGIVAVVGEVDAADFNEQNLASLEWVGPRAMRHAAVADALLRVASVLPVKFGTMFASADNLINFLAQNRQAIVKFLHKLHGKSEWGVKGYADEELAKARVRDEDPAIRARTEALSPSPGLRYLQQKQIDTLVAAALHGWLDERAREIVGALATKALESAELRLLSNQVSGRSDRMFFNRSFLVEDAALEAFRSTIDALNEAGRGDGLTLEINGPWPPYNFCPELQPAR